MKMGKPIRSFYLSRIIQKSLDKEFGSTAVLNEDRVKELIHNKKFSVDIERVRKELKIPFLDEKDDFVSFDIDIGYKSQNISDSDWFLTNVANQEDKLKSFDEKVNEITTMYSLPFNFREWLKGFIIYGKRPRFIPKYPLAYGTEFLISRLPLRTRMTTEEKRFYRESFRKEFKLPKTGRIPKKFLSFYKKLNEYLDRSENKNKNRKQKNLDIGLKVISRHGKQIDQEYRLDYKDLVANISETDEKVESKSYKRKVQNLRKISQRTKDRLSIKSKN